MKKDNKLLYLNNSKIETYLNEIHKIKLIGDSLAIKSILREYRTLYNINKKSQYVIQLKDLKIRKSEGNSEIIFVYPDEGIELFSLINTKVYDYKKEKQLIRWILFQILKGLETLHSLNIIHRDINSYHILISSQGGIKIIGLSHSINDIESKFVDDKIIGLLPYIAPENLIAHNFNNKVDIWSVGVIMLELYSRKTFYFDFNLNDEKKDDPIIFLNQLKYLANKFSIPFPNNLNQNNINLKEELINWLSNARLEPKKFNEIFGKIPDMEEDGLELLRGLLAFNPKERITAKEALKSKYFKDFQHLNTEEYKKSKIKENEHLSLFLKNLEKEFQKADQLPLDKKNEIFQREINNIYQNRFVGKNN